MEFYFKNSLLGWAIKNSKSQYVYANDRACHFFNILPEKIVGCLDRDIIQNVDDYYRHIINDDKKIIDSQKMSVVMKVFSYGEKEVMKAFLVEKRPWRFNDGSAGIICTWLELTNVYFSTFLSQCSRRPLVFTKPSDYFTDREWEVILLLLCCEQQHVISEILGISAFTLRNRVVRCCQKAGVINVEKLLEFCHSRGWDNYLPPFFLAKRHLIIS